MEESVTQIHEYPRRPMGFAEPLFPTAESRLAVMDHLLESGWLGRASDLARGLGQAAHAHEEPVEIRRSRSDERAVLVFRCGRRSRRKVVAEVLERWREVGGWWTGGEDRYLYRLLLVDGAVVDVARDRASGEWTLVGVVD
ncbi:MAG: hypothetical protein M3522_13695 [Actinomycetota bacterium]|nr:hypothetical protein [Actinomycetota bacterium]